ncbi:hypothetical protein BDV96DRAFT_500540 [Lophiotrema nucula]|uniref:Tyrosine specific protein phosphatases domain-containing protein n=1 Tax=Lophiotrema nucula TaxID=690887 RepID=A0A6A5YUP0_9PLEO|nr:hypothetical protein BDV96DRAFT_500540 [Lophiotrema nucula]
MEPHSRQQHGTFLLPQALVLLLRTCFAESSDKPVSPSHTDLSLSSRLSSIKASLDHLIARLLPFVDRRAWGSSIFVGMVELTAICGVGTALWLWSKHKEKGKRPGSSQSSRVYVSEPVCDDTTTTDPGLLKKHSEIKPYTVPSTGFTYPSIRTFYRPHPQGSKLPNKPNPIPLLVFVHGLGGSAAQFHPMLVSLVNLAPCLAIDLPGCGRSSFEPKAWKAYTTEALARLLAVAIETYRDKDGGQRVVLLGHSMGCSLVALLASSTSPIANLVSENVAGVVTICPQAGPPSEHQSQTLKRVTWIPAAAFDLLRKWDRRGGVNSKSVVRMAGPDAEDETKKLQLRFNQQSKTPVWMRMARGMLPGHSSGEPNGGLPGQKVWAGLHLPVFIAAGEVDTVTPVENVRQIVKFLGRDVAAIEPPNEKVSLPIAAAPMDPAVVDLALGDRKHHDSGIDASDLPHFQDERDRSKSIAMSSTNLSLENTEGVPSTVETETIGEPATAATTSTNLPSVPSPHPRRLVVKTIILPKPAAHSLIFAPSSSRILSGLIGTFLADHIDPRLSLGWQLQYLTTEGKWDVKNLAKWKAVVPVSDPIANTFRAMKTLREVDEQHSPKTFVKEWAGKLRAVVDISHESPVYDPKGLEDGGIQYFKFPTVSKLPPTVDEVKAFVELIDKIKSSTDGRTGLVGVHCHYGYNRTGFFLVSYLVEKLKYRVEDAIDEFAKARPPGVRHDHFIDQLHVRYCVGLRKAPTL